MVADGEFAVGDGFWPRDCVACGIAVPVYVFFRWVAQVVDLVGRVIGVDVDGCSVDGAMELVGGVFDAPEP